MFDAQRFPLAQAVKNSFRFFRYGWGGQNQWDPILVGRCTSILEPILVGIGMFTGGNEY